MSCGGYIKYVDLNITKIKYGILSKITKDEHDNVVLVLKNTKHKFHWKIMFSKYYVFYKQHTPKDNVVLRNFINTCLNEYKNKIK